MSKKRHKENSQQRQKIEEAKRRNDFFKRLAIFCKDISGQDVFRHIPKECQDFMYKYRPKALIVLAADGHALTPKFLDSVKIFINWFLKDLTVSIEETKTEVSLSDYYSLGFPLHSYLHLITNTDRRHKNSDEVTRVLSDACGDRIKLFNTVYGKIWTEIIPNLSLLTNNIAYHYYSFNLDFDFIDLRDRIKIIVSKHDTEKIILNINNIARTAFRVGWTIHSEFRWMEVTPSQLSLKSSFEDLKIPVYIQAHALQRLTERLDCMEQFFIQFSIFTSLHDCKAIHDKNKFLIEFKLDKVKVGYLSAMLVDGRLIIRTFLFLTFNSTPEGKKLEEFAGLKKQDTEYLKMDRLSSFMTDKLKSNPELSSIFTSAGCSHLLDLHEKLGHYSLKHLDHSPIERLSSYLKNNNIMEEWKMEEG